VLGRALRHPPGSIALDWAQRTAEKIGHLVIAHLVEIAIAKADCPETNRLPGQMASPFSRAKPRACPAPQGRTKRGHGGTAGSATRIVVSAPTLASTTIALHLPISAALAIAHR